MKPRERRETGEQDLFRSRLDQIIDLKHPLVALARAVDWGFLENEFGAVYTDGPGQPPLPTRLMAGLIILKYTHNLSDEVLCERWVENPYYQFFCGEEFFQHELVLDRSSLSNWRKRMGEEKVKALLQESLSIAAKTGAVKPSELSEVIVDTTVQPKNVMFPTDARLLNRAREILARLSKKHGVKLRQSYARVGKFALIKHQRYAHAKQFKRANRALKKLKTYLGRVIRDVDRKIEGDVWLKEMVFAHILSLARRVRDQKQHQRGPKVYSLHAPEVECIGKGKAHRPYEFGVKISVATTHRHAKGGQFVTHVKSLPGNPLYGAFEVKHLFHSILHFLHSSFFVRLGIPFLRPDPTRVEARTGAVKVGRRSALAARSVVSRPRLDRPEHGGTRWLWSGRRSEGSLPSGADHRATTLYSVGP